ncbi:hypothetical protein [Salibacterium aidingense]|uniref:hypothetical protein n=1 Tax=Salibacterium aidingense TaxID=384933 RepID=UPI000403D5A8|nr:hypothetical protein [Salibacterium aidingense]
MQFSEKHVVEGLEAILESRKDTKLARFYLEHMKQCANRLDINLPLWLMENKIRVQEKRNKLSAEQMDWEDLIDEG